MFRRGMKSILLPAILIMTAAENPNKVFDSLFTGSSKYNPDYKKQPVHRELKEFCIKGEKVMAIIHQYNSDAKVGDQLKDDLMFDSLDMVKTAMSVEKEFSISITDEEMEDPMWDTATVQDLIDFVKGKMDELG